MGSGFSVDAVDPLRRASVREAPVFTTGWSLLSPGLRGTIRLGDLDHHGLAVLVQRGVPDPHDAPVGIRLRRPDLQDLGLDAQDVAGEDGPGPSDLLHADPDQAAGDPEVALDHRGAS